MQLLPDELRAEKPKLYSQEHVTMQEKTVQSFSFQPELELGLLPKARKKMVITFVVGFEEEWGYFTLNELQTSYVKSLTVEKDSHFKPGRFADVINHFRIFRNIP